MLAMSQSHAFQLVTVATISAAVAGLIGALAAWLLRRRSIAVQVLVVALDAVLAVAIGVRFAVGAMLVAPEDLQAVDVALIAAGAVAVLAAWLLGRRVGRTSATLVAAAARVGDTEPEVRRASAPATATAPLELARLAAQLDETSTRLYEAHERERRLDASRRELIAWVSHDLRTPLAGIRAIAEALEDGVVQDDDTVRRYHRTLREEADHLAGLVDDLFELSRAQSGALHLELARISLGDVVSDAISGARPIATAKGVRLVGELGGPPPELTASAPELLRVLRNILENAIRHTPADGTVVDEAVRADDTAFVTVLYSGGGIPESDLPRVFDVAYRGDAARHGSGAGLGLAIARSLVEAHRGDIQVCNENGGARFTVSLPLDTVRGT